MTKLRLSRRAALGAAAALPLVGSLAARRALAAAEMMGPALAPFRRVRLGAFDVTTLLAGTRTSPNPQETFGMNVSAEEFARVSAANFLPADRTQTFFTPTLVNTGAELVLFDTGLNADGIIAALAAAGHAPEQVDVVVLTHMHGDHIGGLAGGATFPNARYVTGQAEFDHWAGAGSDGFEANVRPLADRMTFVGDGDSIAGGITAMAAFGHTPGHMAWLVESAGAMLAITADAANHHVWSLAHPRWEVRFDADKSAAAETRERLFGMIAAERIPFVGYHMPFPAIGYVEPAADGGFRYVPMSYQLMLDPPEG